MVTDDLTSYLLGAFSGVLGFLALVGLVYILVDETKKQRNARAREKEALLVKRKQ